MGKRIQPPAAKAAKDEPPSFGERLASLRKAARFTQVGLAAELGISQRMVAYYESPAATPPANLLPQIAAALGVSIYELFGVGKRRLAKQEATRGCVAACWRSRSWTWPRSARCFSCWMRSSSAGN